MWLPTAGCLQSIRQLASQFKVHAAWSTRGDRDASGHVGVSKVLGDLAACEPDSSNCKHGCDEHVLRDPLGSGGFDISRSGDGGNQRYICQPMFAAAKQRRRKGGNRDSLVKAIEVVR